MPIVMGTAGHIDHGKTSLIRTLTGVDCDRLEEEKRRGITIELGFAYLPLPDGKMLSIVDVPGHEKFVKNMVAGAAGIDFVALVIAADEGVMPQTREHLEICSLLGITHGLVVLTKVDMVDAEWLALVTEDVKTFLQGTFLQDAPIYPVSSQTGSGIEDLKKALYAITASFNPRRRSDLPRLPVDRVFSIKGYGTVVTGTLISGAFQVGEELALMPSGLTSKVRGLQSHGHKEDAASAGFRTAVNLPMLEVSQIQRGEVLTTPETLFPSDSWIIEAHCLGSAPRALRNRMEVHFHHGAREVQARLTFYDRDKLQPGERCLARVRFNEPMVGIFADRCVMRSCSPLRTVAGGTLLHPLALDLRRKDTDFERKLMALSELANYNALSLDKIVSLQLALRGRNGASFRELRVLMNEDSASLEKALQQLGSKQQVFMVDREERRYIEAPVADALTEACLDWFTEFHKREPMKTGASRNTVSSAWGRSFAPKLVHFVLERLLKQGLLVSEGEVIRRVSYKASLAGGAAGVRESLLKVYREAGAAPPNLKDVLEMLKMSPKEVAPLLAVMQEGGELVKINEALYYAGETYSEIRDMVIAWFRDHDDLGPAEIKNMTGLSRKYLIPLLEYFDKSKLTVRVGDKRVLRDRSAL